MKSRILQKVILIWVLLTMLFASCAKEQEVTPTNLSEEQFVGSLELEEYPLDDELRMIIKDKRKADGALDGVMFDFNSEIGSRTPINLHLYFRKGDQIIVPQAPAKLTINSHDAGKKRYKGSFTITLPPGLIGVNLEETPVYVAGAIGVKSINAQGQAIIDPSHEIVGGKYIIPMYFEERPLHKQGNGYAIADVFLKVYGSLLQVNLKSELYAPVYLKGLGLTTKAFSTEGSMNLRTATASSAPTWNSSSNVDNIQSVRLNTPVVLKNAQDTKSLFIWIKPDASFKGDNNQNTAELTLDIFDNDNSSMGSLLGKYSVNKTVADRAVFRIKASTIKSDLIFSEYHRWDNTNIVWEFYNPTNKPIDLRQYYIIRDAYHTTSLKMVQPLITDALKLHRDNVDASIDGSSSSSLTRVGNESNRRYMLPPGKVALFAATAQGLDKGDVRSAYTFNFYPRNTASEHTVFAPDYDNTSQRQGKEYYMLAKGGTDEQHVVDVFFRFENASVQSAIGPAKKLVNAKYLRKPDRNFGRKYFPAKMSESDWVWRSALLHDWDWGYRFGYYYWDIKENRYIDGKRADKNLVVFHMDSYNGNVNDVHGTPYIVPTYWAQGVAH